MSIFFLFHFSEKKKYKQTVNSPRWDAAFCGITSGAILFAYVASGAVRRGFTPLPHHTKGGKNGTGSSLPDARNKRVVPGRYKKAGTYSLLGMPQ